MSASDPTVLEIADIRIQSGREREFVAAMVQARHLLRRVKGFRGMELRRVIERPDRYHLLVRWETMEDHTVGFQKSDHFREWRTLVGPFFASNPSVDHSLQVISLEAD